VAPGGRLAAARPRTSPDAIRRELVKPSGLTQPRLDPKIYPIEDDQQFAYELLAEQKVLIVQGTGFNWHSPDHLRVVFLPNSDDLSDAIGRIATFLEHYRNRHARHAA
jgi:alanine-synthesizing transaminase